MLKRENWTTLGSLGRDSVISYFEGLRGNR